MDIMEPPKPIQIQALQNEEKIIKKLDLNIESKTNIKYSLEILGYTSYMNIIINTIDDIGNKTYEAKFSLEDIKNISKYFLICESISDAIISIESNIHQSNIIEENNKIKLVIPLSHPLCKEAIFILSEKIKIFDPKDLYYIITEMRNNFKKQNDTIIEMRNNLKNQQNIVNDQRETIDKQQKIINALQDNILNLKERVEILEKRNNIMEKNNEEYYLNNSKIIPNDYQKEKEIKKWINPNKKIKFELLFRKSRDGSKSSDFHKCCDNKGPTLTLVKTSKNYIFGAYTPFSWKSKISYSPDNDRDTFLFSLNLMKKFNKIKDDSTVYFAPNFCPCFGQGGSDFYINDDLNRGTTIPKTFLQNYDLTGGKQGAFQVEELEIYKVI